MGYVSKEHRCILPSVEGNDDVWECDECHRLWRSFAPGNPAYNSWRPLSSFRRWLLKNTKEQA